MNPYIIAYSYLVSLTLQPLTIKSMSSFVWEAEEEENVNLKQLVNKRLKRVDMFQRKCS